MRETDILDDIDDALTDWHGSDDAARWSPERAESDQGWERPVFARDSLGSWFVEPRPADIQRVRRP